MEKNKTNIWIITILILGTLANILFYTCSRRHVIPPEPTPQTETVYVSRPYKPSKPLKFPTFPRYVFFYQKGRIDTITHVEIQHDSLFFYYKDTVDYVNHAFLTQYPWTERLIQLSISRNTIDISSQDTDGQVQMRNYEVDLNKYRYLYVNNEMTYERNRTSFFKVKPFISTQYRPINKLYDVNFGVTHNTSNFQYEVGINAHYYPKYTKKLGGDVYLQLKYQF